MFVREAFHAGMMDEMMPMNTATHEERQRHGRQDGQGLEFREERGGLTNHTCEQHGRERSRGHHR